MIDAILDKMFTLNFLSTIIQDTISGIVIGATITLIGYFIWKKQNLYSKKFDVYINVLSSIQEIYQVVVNDNKNKKNPNFDDFYGLDGSLFLELKKNKMLFVSFFGKQYNEKIEYFINFNKHIERVQITHENETRFFKPEEYTADIIQEHKQQVLEKMVKHMKELEMASNSLRKYALLK
jgi:hypothetical protein